MWWVIIRAVNLSSRIRWSVAAINVALVWGSSAAVCSSNKRMSGRFRVAIKKESAWR